MNCRSRLLPGISRAMPSFHARPASRFPLRSSNGASCALACDPRHAVAGWPMAQLRVTLQLRGLDRKGKEALHERVQVLLGRPRSAPHLRVQFVGMPPTARRQYAWSDSSDPSCERIAKTRPPSSSRASGRRGKREVARQLPREKGARPAAAGRQEHHSGPVKQDRLARPVPFPTRAERRVPPTLHPLQPRRSMSFLANRYASPGQRAET
jgi:hypothetical protein